MKRLLLAAAALTAAAAVWVGVSLPPARLTLSSNQTSDGTIAGNLHIHSRDSDGGGSLDEIAAAASRAGLKFIVLTDHGDGTGQPSAPVYREGVLCLGGVEISTAGGHYVAIGLPEAPYPLGGEARDVVEDVKRLGGFGIAAHPDSPKDDLRWRDWTTPFDALEIVNPDTSWRVHVQQRGWRPKLRLLEALTTYPFRPGETIAGLLNESPALLTQWASLTRSRRVVALAGVDAHARLALNNVDARSSSYALPFPSYEASFRALSVHVRTAGPLTGDAPADAKLVIDALREGHLYVALDGVAFPPLFEFTATGQKGVAREGDEITAGGPLMLRVRSNRPAAFTTTIWQGMQVFATGDAPDFAVAAPDAPAVYRVEIRATDDRRRPPWIRSNPIYVRGAGPASTVTGRPAARESQTLFDGRDASGWRVEADPTSLVALDLIQGPEGGELRVRYGLSSGPPVRQFAALTLFPRGGLASHDRLTFTARAERPMRISVQLRAAVTPPQDDRWQRSVYLDTVGRGQTVYFDDFTPIGVTSTSRPPLAAVHSLVFAIDTTNTKPGSSGRVWIKNVALQR